MPFVFRCGNRHFHLFSIIVKATNAPATDRSQHGHAKAEDKRFVDRLFQHEPRSLLGTGR